jgi:hypothetical protein
MRLQKKMTRTHAILAPMSELIVNAEAGESEDDDPEKIGDPYILLRQRSTPGG